MKIIIIFEIKEVKGLVNYQLKLPKSIRIHDIFHVLLLKKVSPNTPLVLFIEVDQLDPKEEQDIDKLLDYQYFNKTIKYLVKQLDRLDSENLQELKKNLSYPKKLQEFYYANLRLLQKDLKPRGNYNLQEGHKNRNRLARVDYQQAGRRAQLGVWGYNRDRGLQCFIAEGALLPPIEPFPLLSSLFPPEHQAYLRS